MRRFIATSAVALCFSLTSALAGPVIIDGTDANEHGGAGVGGNTAGWLYMQEALENLGPAVGNGNNILVSLGVSAGSATTSINSAFNLSALNTPAGGSWTHVIVDGDANITSYLAGNMVNGVDLDSTGIIYITTYGNAGGDLTAAEMAAVNAGATAIANFVGGAGDPTMGGGLFTQAETGTGAYGWLTTLIPGIVATDVGGGGIGTNITLTAAGTAAFPGLTNADLAGADPWHGHFSGNLGSLSVLGVANDNQGVSRNVIIGGGAGTVITPDPVTPGVPDSGSTIALLTLGLLGLAALRRRLNG